MKGVFAGDGAGNIGGNAVLDLGREEINPHVCGETV